MSDSAEFFTIGRLARRTGVSARTIRFWSDAGLVPASTRQLLEIINGRAPHPPAVPSFEWLIAALRADGA